MDRRLSILARKQHGLVTAAQLSEVGLSDSAVSKRVRAGRLHRIHRGVYAVGHRPVHQNAARQAAVLAIAGDAAISHLSAAIVWGLVRDPGSYGQPIDVLTTRRMRAQPGIRVHFTRAFPLEDLTWTYAIPHTTPLRTLIDIAPLLSREALMRALRQAEVQWRLDTPSLVRRLRQDRGRRGAAALLAIAETGPAPTRSVLEDRALDLFLAAGLPRPRVNARLTIGERTYEVDFLFAERQLIVETDGDRFHGTPTARKLDAAKQAALEDAGYRVLRVTWDQIDTHGAQTVRRLRRALDLQLQTSKPGVRDNVQTYGAKRRPGRART